MEIQQDHNGSDGNNKAGDLHYNSATLYLTVEGKPRTLHKLALHGHLSRALEGEKTTGTATSRQRK
jgi:hypothetical protein